MVTTPADSEHRMAFELKAMLNAALRITYSKEQVLALKDHPLSLGYPSDSPAVVPRPVAQPTRSSGEWVRRKDSEERGNQILRAKPTAEVVQIQQAAKHTSARITATKDEEELLCRDIKITLNKLSPGNLLKLETKLFLLAKSQTRGSELLTGGIFDKACNEVKFTRLYAELCQLLERQFIEEGVVEVNAHGHPTSLFKIAIIKKCQEVFESSTDGSEADKCKVLGNVRFIGELYKTRLLNPKVVLECVRDLIDVRLRTMKRFTISELHLVEDRLEGVCMLFPLVLEEAGIRPLIDSLLKLLTSIKQGRADLSQRIRYLLLVWTNAELARKRGISGATDSANCVCVSVVEISGNHCSYGQLRVSLGILIEMASYRGRVAFTPTPDSFLRDNYDPYKLGPNSRDESLRKSAEVYGMSQRKLIQSVTPEPKSARKDLHPGLLPLPDLPKSRSVPRDMNPRTSLSVIDAIRKHLRQRYESRTNMRKIFTVWDRENLGYVRPEDVLHMMSNMGFSLSQEEAGLLVASANRSKTGRLNLEEFLELIFTEDSDVSPDVSASSNLDVIRSSLQDRAMLKRERSINDLLHIKIKTRLHELTQLMMRKDPDRKGFVNFKDFCAVMDSLLLPAEIGNMTQWEKLYSTMGGDASGLDIRLFVEKIRQTEDVERPKNPLVNEYYQKIRKNSKSSASAREDLSSSYNVLDGQTVPVHTLELMQAKSRKVKRLLRSRYQSEDALKLELTKFRDGEGISLDRLQNFVSREAITDLSVTRKDIEGFLSTVQYSAHGYADIKAIVRSMFLEEYRDDSLTRRTRALPPCRSPGDHSYSPLPPARLSSLLRELEDKLSIKRSQRVFDAFRLFDSDADGYISYEDFDRGLTQLKIIHESEEAAQLMEFLDEKKNGFLSFDDFAKGVRTDARKEVYTALQPSKNLYKRHLEALQVHPVPDPLPEVKRTPSTRFGLKPPGSVTKEVFQPSSNVAFYSDEKSRFPQKNLQPISLAQEDRDRRQKMYDAKLNVIKEYRDREKDLAAKQERSADELRNRKVWHKAYAKDNYEKVWDRQRCRVMQG